MSAAISRTGSKYRVTCDEHSLDRVVDTPAHATNLAQLHDRLDHPTESTGGTHPESLNLTDAALYLVLITQDPLLHVSADAGLKLWSLLIGATDPAAALAYAHHVAEHPTTAHVPPL